MVTIVHQVKKHVDEIIEALEKKFNKSKRDAIELVKMCAVHEDLMINPLGLHDSPEAWVLILVTEKEDLDAINFYFEH